MTERARVDHMGFDLGIGDRLQVLGVGQVHANAFAADQVTESVIAAGNLDRGNARARKAGEVGVKCEGITGELAGLEGSACPIGRGDGHAPLTRLEKPSCAWRYPLK